MPRSAYDVAAFDSPAASATSWSVRRWGPVTRPAYGRRARSTPLTRAHVNRFTYGGREAVPIATLEPGFDGPEAHLRPRLPLLSTYDRQEQTLLTIAQ